MGRAKRSRKNEANKHKLITKYIPNSPISEQYRTLRTNIQFLSKDKTIRSITVTSSGSGEGKSTVTSNLAVVFSQLGKRVLLVDTDLRRPNQHHIFKVTNSFGISNVLGNQVHIDHVIQETEVKGLSILTSGSIPPNPAELLGSEEMVQLLDYLHEIYDLVIFDTPPILVVTDAQLVANNTDASLLVVESGSTEINRAQQASEILSSTNSRFIGVVINKKPLDKKVDQYYY